MLFTYGEVLFNLQYIYKQQKTFFLQNRHECTVKNDVLQIQKVNNFNNLVFQKAKKPTICRLAL